ncbi:hypothetical protein SAMN05661080_02580 [Modestobacter sp. DSM 44400]|nr:hypothetical protein SAMN05661080_02580 [Modestobacter sp. DSM 44400]
MAMRPDRSSVVERELRRLLNDVAPEPHDQRIDVVTPEGRRGAGGPVLAVALDEAAGRHGVVARERALAERAARIDARVAAGAAGAAGAVAAEAGARAGLADLLGVRRLGGTALGHRPHRAPVGELRGQLLALTDAAGLRRGQGLRPPGESPGGRSEGSAGALG